jgi:hypothetical protein
MSEIYQSLSHSKWDCKYHVVFTQTTPMKKLPPVNKKSSSVLGPPGFRRRHGKHTFAPYNSIAAVKPLQSAPATRSARLFRLTSIRTRALVESSSARFQLEVRRSGAAIFETVSICR